jgi:dTDP-4-dehydrorhamnose 3,5-epimerase
MKFLKTAIDDVIIIEPEIYGDDRGFFLETYQARLFKENGIPHEFVQDNHSGSRQGVLRGLHYQLHQTQGKLLRVIDGEIYDAAVDIRRSSPTFGQWVGTILSSQNKYQLWVPPGFAQGFYVLSQWAEVLYKVTDYYAPGWDRTILWNDPQIGIQWPLLEGQAPILSEKDAKGSLLAQAEVFD